MYKTHTNLFKIGYSPWRYLGNWWHNIKRFFRTFKFIYQRAKYGYSDYDLYDFDLFLEEILLRALGELEAKGSYPCTYNSAEEWSAELEKTRTHLLNALIEPRNVFLDLIIDYQTRKEKVPKSLREQFWEEEKRIYAQREDELQIVMDWLSKNIHNLWY